MKDKLQVALFSGGRGTETISEALLKHPRLSLTVLVNAYDDGLSTGALRRLIPGMLGPSDIRKNIVRLIPDQEKSDQFLKSLLEFRLPIPMSFDDGIRCLKGFTELDPSHLPEKLAFWFQEIRHSQAIEVGQYAGKILEYINKKKEMGEPFEFSDCSVGNLLFSGCYLLNEQSFNKATQVFQRFARTRGTVLNITYGENLVLVGLKDDGTFLKDESEIVSKQSSARIREIFLLKNYLTSQQIEFLSSLSLEEKLKFLRNCSVFPELNPDAKDILKQADIIVYGPGTQHSSLFPSYLTSGLAEVISENSTADKFFIANIKKDHEIQTETSDSLFRKFLFYMGRKNELSVSWEKLTTKFFFQSSESKDPENYVHFLRDEFSFPLKDVILGDWESRSGIHSGGRILDELIRLVNYRLQTKLKPLPHLVSIIVPGLNEAKTVKKVLHDLSMLDFQSLGLNKEIIFVDGGSTDDTVELARSESGVKVIELKDVSGRGHAIRKGIDSASGNIIVTFPCDGEYLPEDLFPIVMAVVKNEYQVVFRSRAIKCVNLNSRIKEIYEGNILGYFVSKYGGILIGIFSLLLHNRFLSDPLTGIKAFDADLLRSLSLMAGGLDLETEIFAKLSMRGQFILELPVAYFPRKKSEGKKTTVFDGFKAILALFPFRFKIREKKNHAEAVNYNTCI